MFNLIACIVVNLFALSLKYVHRTLLKQIPSIILVAGNSAFPCLSISIHTINGDCLDELSL